MIDTMFFLVVSLMLATLAMTPMTGIRVAVPKASTGERSLGLRLYLTLTKDHRLFLDRRPITFAQVESLLRDRLSRFPGTLVIINADREARHGEVIALMDAAKRAGVQRMAVATDPLPLPRIRGIKH